MKRRSLFSVTRSHSFGITFGSVLSTCVLTGQIAFGQQGVFDSIGHSANESAFAANAQPLQLPYAQFQIPFSVDPAGPAPSLVQLWVSTDGGSSWQKQGNAAPDARNFPFRAAAEGLYLFSVRTIDEAGNSHASSTPPLRVNVDTTKPLAAMRADIDEAGRLAIDLRVMDINLNPQSAELRLRTDRDPNWQSVSIPGFSPSGNYLEARTTTELPACREVALVFTVQDQAGNVGEATFRLAMPRTAQAEADLRLASVGDDQRTGMTPFASHGTQEGRPKLTPMRGAMEWKADATGPGSLPQSGTPSVVHRPGLGYLTSSEGLPPLSGHAGMEELPLPPAVGSSADQFPVLRTEVSRQELAPTPQLELFQNQAGSSSSPLGADTRSPGADQPLSLDLPARSSWPEPQLEQKPQTLADDADSLLSLGQAFHCKSRAFSLDYSVDSLAGSALADVELWGTEDGGREWAQWGSDPDRLSPFDVQVGNDGLFGFRMVIVGANGLVSNRPKNGDTADVWINVDTNPPSAKITRAVYGEGPEMGMLVIDYQCGDSHLVDRPVSLAYSERPEGPWTTFVSGQKNTGMYLWKANPSLPDRIYLKLDVVDKAGNIGSHRLDLPIDTKGLAPRGRIHGFRPIAQPGS